MDKEKAKEYWRQRYYTDPDFRRKEIQRVAAYQKKQDFANTKLCTMINGKVVTLLHVKKRLRPLDMKCENCGNVRKRLEYHHWDNFDLMKGVWLCHGCHKHVNFIEGPKGLRNYLLLREKLERATRNMKLPAELEEQVRKELKL